MKGIFQESLLISEMKNEMSVDKHVIGNQKDWLKFIKYMDELFWTESGASWEDEELQYSWKNQ